jgi:type IV pilus assembly protein PilX
MKIKRTVIEKRSNLQRQRGMVSTLIAIIVLVVSLFAAVALMRSVDTSNTIAGSLTFRQGVVQEAERAYVDSRTAFTYTEPASDANQGNGFYASPQPQDTTRPDLPAILTVPTPVAGTVTKLAALNTENTVWYVVERLCPAPGLASPTTCVVPGASIEGGSVSNQTKDNGPPFNTGASVAFRLTVRVDGPKGTVGYVQTILH